VQHYILYVTNIGYKVVITFYCGYVTTLYMYKGTYIIVHNIT